MQGSGRVRDLREAASVSGEVGETLTNTMSNFANTATRAEQIAQLDHLLRDWSQSAGMPDIVACGMNNLFCKMQNMHRETMSA